MKMSKVKMVTSRMLVASMLVATLPLAGCMSTTAQTQESIGGRFEGHQIAFRKGGVERWAVLVVDRAAGGQIVVNFGGETLTLGRQLVENLMSPGVLAAVISGAAGIEIAGKGNCGGKGCGGSIYYLNATAGSVSSTNTEVDVEAEASSGGGHPKVHMGSKGSGESRQVITLTEEQMAVYKDGRQVLAYALENAY